MSTAHNTEHVHGDKQTGSGFKEGPRCRGLAVDNFNQVHNLADCFNNFSQVSGYRHWQLTECWAEVERVQRPLRLTSRDGCE